MILETLLAVTGLAEAGTRLYDWFTGASVGEKARIRLKEAERTSTNIIKISNNLFYQPNCLEAINLGGDRYIADIREISRIASPLSDALQSPLLISGINRSPQALKTALSADPWSVLFQVRPAEKAVLANAHDQTPILFLDGGRPYVGWQMTAALPHLFGCAFNIDGAKRGIPDLVVPPDPLILTSQNLKARFSADHQMCGVIQSVFYSEPCVLFCERDDGYHLPRFLRGNTHDVEGLWRYYFRHANPETLGERRIDAHNSPQANTSIITDYVYLRTSRWWDRTRTSLDFINLAPLGPFKWLTHYGGKLGNSQDEMAMNWFCSRFGN